MAPHNEEDDPAIYRSGSHKKSKAPDSSSSTASGSRPREEKGHTEKTNGDDAPEERHEAEAMEMEADEDDDEDAEEEDSTLLAVQPGFNRLLLVLRDERVMRFVKYVSAAAEGSRWDVCGEYEVGMMQEDDSESE
jgi:hypothetical protein